MIRNSRPFLATKLCQILFQTHNQMKATNMLLYGIEGENSKITGCVHPGSLRGEIVSFPFLVAGSCLHAWGGALSLFSSVLYPKLSFHSHVLFLQCHLHLPLPCDGIRSSLGMPAHLPTAMRSLAWKIVEYEHPSHNCGNENLSQSSKAENIYQEVKERRSSGN